jgi:ABC-type Mn2+/Zn2+ transport system permease subunit
VLEVLLLFREAVIGSALIALGCSVVGVYVVYRRVVFVSAALAQLSSAGVATALFLAGLGIGLGPLSSELLMSSMFTLGGVIFFGLEADGNRVPGDARLGIAYVLAGAAAILLVSRAAGGDAHALLLRGNILGIQATESWRLLAVVTAVLGVHLLFRKEFVFISYDPEMAASKGYRVRSWTIFLYLTMGAVIVASIESAGVLLVFSLLVLPAVTGIQLGRTLGSVTVISAVSGVTAAVAGFALSVELDLPTGPAIVATSGVFLLLAWALARMVRRG